MSDVQVHIEKADGPERLAFGWASVIEENGVEVVDRQGDVMSEAELEKCAYDFAENCRAAGEMHTTIGVGQLVESVVLTKAKQEALGIDLGKVGWWVGFRLSPEVFAKVADGTYRAFSIGGTGQRVRLDVEDAPVAKAAQAMTAHDANTSKVPFPHDGGSLALLRNDQVPRFLGCITHPDRLPIRDVDLDSLVAIQNRVDTAKVSSMAEAEEQEGDDGLPVVGRWADADRIIDGHHRLAAAWVRGDGTARVRYANLSPLSNAMKPFQKGGAGPLAGMSLADVRTMASVPPQALTFAAILKMLREPAGSSKGGQFKGNDSAAGYSMFGGGKKGPGSLAMPSGPVKAKSFASALNTHWAGDAKAKGPIPTPPAPPPPPPEPTSPHAWGDATKSAVFRSDTPASGSLNGVAFAPWTGAPRTAAGWQAVAGQNHDLIEPELPIITGKHAAAGVIIKEPDGRIWVVEPTKHYGGYRATFPKGTAEEGIPSLQANAIKEAFEESGLQVRITGHLGDYERDTSIARYYTAERVGGSPSSHGWETQAVHLVPQAGLSAILNRSVDKGIGADVALHAALGGLQKVAKAATFTAILKAGGFPRDVRQPGRHDGAVTFAKAIRHQPAGSSKGGQFMPKEGGEGGGVKPVSAKAAGWAVHHNSAAQWAAKKIAALDKLAEKDPGGLDAHDTAPKSASPNTYQKEVHAHHKKLIAWHEANKAEAEAGPPDRTLSIEGWAKAGGQLGSNKGGTYTSTDGKAHYVKEYQTNSHAHNEVLADRLLEAAGVPTLHHQAIHLGNGKKGVTSPWQEKGANFDPKSKAHRDEIAQHFAAHAWLANWDAVGPDNTNTAMVGGKLHSTDTGGALLFRAQGEHKGAAFGTTVGEWNSMRDKAGGNPHAAAAFGKMTSAQLIASAKHVEAISPDHIKKLVGDYGPGTKAERSALADKLIARRADIVAKAAALKADLAGIPPTTTPPAPAGHPAAIKPVMPKFAQGAGSGAKFAAEVEAHLAAGNLAKLKDHKAILVELGSEAQVSMSEDTKKSIVYLDQAIAHLEGKAPPVVSAPAPSALPAEFPAKPTVTAVQHQTNVTTAEVAMKAGNMGVLRKLKEGYDQAFGVDPETGGGGASAKAAHAYINQAVAHLSGSAKTKTVPAPNLKTTGIPQPEKVVTAAKDASVQKMHDATHALGVAGDVAGLQKQQAKYAAKPPKQSHAAKNAAQVSAWLAHLGSTPSAAPVMAAVVVDHGAAAPKAKGKKATAPPPNFQASKLPPTPDFHNFKGPGVGLSSHAEYNDANLAESKHILSLAQKGTDSALEELAAYKIKSPSSKVASYRQQVAEDLHNMLHPPIPVEMVRLSGEPAAKFHAIDAASPALKSVTEITNKVGFYPALAKIGSPADLALEKTDSLENGKLTPNTYGAAVKAKYDGLSHAVAASVKSYTGGGYDNMNDSFRAGSPTASALRADTGVREIMVPMKVGTVLSRKVSMSGGELSDFVNNSTGTVIQEFGISSTSINPRVWGGSVHLRMTLGEGVKGAYVGDDVSHLSPVSGNAPEKEVILPTNCRMVVTSIRPVSDLTTAEREAYWGHNAQYVVDVTVLPTT